MSLTCKISRVWQGHGSGSVARSMQLIAGRTAQEYNQRKGRGGAFCEHLHRCLVYVDLNMVRSGVVNHPAKWEHSGYHEIQAPPERYA
jgi:putative transposase